MKTIIVKTQAELDALPAKFDEYTVIEIRSEPGIWLKVDKARGSSRVVARGSSRVVARGSSQVVARGSSQVEALESSRVVAWESSRVVAWGSSQVEARGSSRVEAHDFTMISVLSAAVVIARLMDYSVASLRDVKAKIEKRSRTATVVRTPYTINRTFKQWLKEGYVHADGITKKFISSKKIGEIEVFEVEEFLAGKSSYVVKRGETFSHGETIEKAIESLRYKITDRDTSKYKKWKTEEKKPVEDLIGAYRAITGACEFGTKQFCESQKLKTKYTVKEVIELTRGKFGSDKFEGFFLK